MSNFYVTFCIGLLLFGVTACTSTAPEEKDDTPGQILTSRNYQPLSQYSPRFRKIMKTDEGVLRGIDFGDELDRVFIEEDTVPSEDSTRFVSFTIELDDEEQQLADVLYYFGEDRKVNSFSLDIYLNTQSAVDSLSNEFQQYYSERYGDPVVQEPKAAEWSAGNDTRILMRDVGIKEAPGLQIQIRKQPQNQ